MMKKLLSIILLICVVLCFPSCSDDKSVKGDDANTTNGDIAPYTTYVADEYKCMCGHSFYSCEWNDFIVSDIKEESVFKLYFFDGKLYCGKSVKKPTLGGRIALDSMEKYRIDCLGNGYITFDDTTGEFVGFKSNISNSDKKREYKTQTNNETVSYRKAENKAIKIAKKFVADIDSYDIDSDEISLGLEITNTEFDIDVGFRKSSENINITFRDFIFTKKCSSYETAEHVIVRIAPSGKCWSASAHQIGVYDNLTPNVELEKINTAVEKRIEEIYNQQFDPNSLGYVEVKLESYQLGRQYLIVSDGYLGMITECEAEYYSADHGSPLELSSPHSGYFFTVIEYIGE